LRVDGRCHCGAIAFEAEVAPGTIGICHCTDCQTLTGSAFRAVIPAPAESFVLRGTPTEYVKTAESGTRRKHTFCPVCGTPIYAAAPEDTASYSLRVGTIRQREQLGLPARQIWCKSALPWSTIEGVPKAERQ
jgi:hypothetical protein